MAKADTMKHPEEKKAQPRAVPLPKTGPTSDVVIDVEATRLSFRVAEGTGGPYFGLGVRKSGSTMLHRILNFLAARNGVNMVDVPGTFFKNGFTTAHWANIDMRPLLRPGNIYTGFRNFPAEIAPTEEYRTARKVFMFRDPRDALVSQYFSDAYSHSMPQAAPGSAGGGRELFEQKRAEALSADIDEWVLLKCNSLRKTLTEYAPVLEDSSCLVLRYEDYVFQKRRLVHKVLQHFGWSIATPQLEKFMGEIDIVPESEDKMRFVRKAVPGDHLLKLKTDTIRRLNNKMKDVLERYDYY